MNEASIFRLLFFTVLIALALVPGLTWLCQKIGLVDRPLREPHKQHNNTVPLSGGLVVFLSFLLVTTVLGVWNDSRTYPVLAGMAIIFLLGLVDDRISLPPGVKFAGQILAAAVVISGGEQVRLFHEQALNIALTIFWLVGITNAFNFVDSMDGLALGLGAITSGFFVLVTMASQQYLLTQSSVVLLGACLSAYYFNAQPARIFLGDSGSQFLGFALAIIGLDYAPLGYSPLASWYVPILLLGVPIFDTCLVVFSRLRRGQPVYQARLDHIYHRLVHNGWSSNRSILTIHFAALLLDCLAFIALNAPPLIANLIFAGVFILGALAIAILDGARFGFAAGPTPSRPPEAARSAPPSGPEIQ